MDTKDGYTRRTFLKTLGLGAAALAAPRYLDAADTRLNIVFILSDDHAMEAIGCYDSWLKDYVHTPFIDSIAAEGMRLTNVCCNMSLCSPSRASIITGQYAHKNGVKVLKGSLSPHAPSYVIELHNTGYQTAIYGKWHMSQMPRGCDDYAITTGQGNYFNPSLQTPDGTKNYTGYYADVYADLALDFLSSRDPSKPFCLNLHFKGTHHPYDYPSRLSGLLEGVDVPIPSNLFEDHAQTSPYVRVPFGFRMYEPDGSKASYYHRHVGEPEMPPDDGTDAGRTIAAFQHMIHKYVRCGAAIDENVGRVLEYLEQEGIKDRTVIVYSSDQGYWLGQHEFYDKRLIYEESLKMPFIVRYPHDVAPGTVCDKLASNVDFAKTFLDFAGVSPHPEMQGCSLRPLLRGKTPPDWQTSIFYYWYKTPPHFGIRNERYKLVHISGRTDIEFYDLMTDPYEMNDLADNPTYTDLIAELENEFLHLMMKVDITKAELPGGGVGVLDDRPPTFNSTLFMAPRAAAGYPYNASIIDDATDLDGDPLVFTKLSGPDWLIIAPDGDLSGTPDTGDMGINEFTVRVEDDKGAWDTAGMNILVYDSSGPTAAKHSIYYH